MRGPKSGAKLGSASGKELGTTKKKNWTRIQRIFRSQKKKLNQKETQQKIF